MARRGRPRPLMRQPPSGPRVWESRVTAFRRPQSTEPVTQGTDRMRAARICAVLAAACSLPTGCAAVNYCCNKVDWSRNWCTRDDCYGLGCRKGEADTGDVCPRIQGRACALRGACPRHPPLPLSPCAWRGRLRVQGTRALQDEKHLSGRAGVRRCQSWYVPTAVRVLVASGKVLPCAGVLARAILTGVSSRAWVHVPRCLVWQRDGGAVHASPPEPAMQQCPHGVRPPPSPAPMPATEGLVDLTR